MRFHIHDSTGHSTEHFTKDDVKAKERFDQLVAEGHRASDKKLAAEGKPSLYGDFNPDVEDTVFIRPLQGG